MIVRPEQAGDERAIRSVTEAAFRAAPHSSGNEQDIVDALRRDGNLALSLVTEDDGDIIGHIAFSPVTVTDGAQDWYGLGPVSVKPEWQRQGVGSALIRRSIADLRGRNGRGIVLLGNPAYYSRFGFEHDPALVYPGPPAEYFQRLVLEGVSPQGQVSYARAFG